MDGCILGEGGVPQSIERRQTRIISHVHSLTDICDIGKRLDSFKIFIAVDIQTAGDGGKVAHSVDIRQHLIELNEKVSFNFRQISESFNAR